MLNWLSETAILLNYYDVVKLEFSIWKSDIHVYVYEENGGDDENMKVKWHYYYYY